MDRSETIAQFQGISNVEDLDLCVRILDAHDWHIEAAINGYFTRGAESYRSRPPVSSSYVQSSSSSSSSSESPSILHQQPQPPPPPQQQGGGITSFLPGPIGGVIQFGFSAVSSVARWVGSYLPSPVQNIIASLTADPANTSNASASPSSLFITRFELKYGHTHPPFLPCSYDGAVEQAKREFRFLIIYLHSEMHSDTDKFCRETLCSENLVDFISSNFLIWGGSINEPEAYQLSSKLTASTYPFLAVLGVIQNQIKPLKKIEGPKTVEELMTIFTQTMEQWGPHLDASRIEFEERDRDRRIREEQDRAYQESLEADRQRERKAQEDAAREEQERLEAERESARQEADAEAKRQARAHKQLLLESKVEPDKGPGVIQILFRIPNGSRLSRRFRASDRLQEVFDFVDCQDLGIDNIGLASNFPKRTFTANSNDANLTLDSAGLQGQCMLFVQEA
mmetsp:Transcript_39451/g.63964  ORF Transcript_39451/g.63964 Transcript_39451/m.63964 type:complete len:453 (+) Transcript_39451:29-1387(+)